MPSQHSVNAQCDCWNSLTVTTATNENYSHDVSLLFSAVGTFPLWHWDSVSQGQVRWGRWCESTFFPLEAILRSGIMLYLDMVLSECTVLYGKPCSWFGIIELWLIIGRTHKNEWNVYNSYLSGDIWTSKEVQQKFSVHLLIELILHECSNKFLSECSTIAELLSAV